MQLGSLFSFLTHRSIKGNEDLGIRLEDLLWEIFFRKILTKVPISFEIEAKIKGYLI